MSIYDFTCKTIDGKEKSLSDYKGKVLIIVNTASKCGFTPQFEELENLYKKYKEQGLEILGFPSNQFAGQDPGTNNDTVNFCRINYGVTFQLFDKGDVRGETAQPIFQYLVKEKPFFGFNTEYPAAKKLENFIRNNFPKILVGDDIKWNFTKFLIDRTGKVIARFEPIKTPYAMEDEIKKLL